METIKKGLISLYRHFLYLIFISILISENVNCRNYKKEALFWSCCSHKLLALKFVFLLSGTILILIYFVLD